MGGIHQYIISFLLPLPTTCLSLVFFCTSTCVGRKIKNFNSQIFNQIEETIRHFLLKSNDTKCVVVAGSRSDMPVGIFRSKIRKEKLRKENKKQKK